MINAIGNFIGVQDNYAPAVVLPDYENADGQQAFLVIGDSTGGAGTNGTTGPGPTPTAGTAYYFRRSNETIIEIEDADLEFAFDPPGNGSQWPQFAVDFNTKLSKKAVIIPCAVGGSSFTEATAAEDWSEDGECYDNAVTDANDCMELMGVTKLRAIFVFLGINDSLGAVALGTVETAINSLVTRLQTDFPDTDIVFYQAGRNSSGANTARLFSIRRYIKNACENNDQCFLIGDLGAGPSGLLVDDIHRNQTGQNRVGAICARWVENSSFDKWARSIISSHVDDLSSARKSYIAPLDTHLASYLNQECLYLGKTTSQDNFFNDWAFMTVPNNLVAVTFTQNDSISTNGTDDIFRPGFQPSLASFKSGQNDIFFAFKVKTNNNAAGVAAVQYGANNSGGTIRVSIAQSNTSVIRYRVNDATSTDYSGRTAIPNDTEVMIYRNGGTKGYGENGVSVHSASVASTGNLDANPNLGSDNNTQAGAAQNFANCSYEWFRAGKHVGTDHAAFYAFLENIVDHWND